MKRLLLLPLALGLLAMSACNDAAEAESPAVESHDDDITPAQFAHGWMAAYGDDMEQASNLMSDGADDLGDGDFDAAADKADEASDLYAGIHDGTPDLPGGDSRLGTKITEVAGICATVLAESADDVRSRDYEAMSDASNHLDPCIDGLHEVTALAESYS